MIDFSCQDKTEELCQAAREHLKQAVITVIGVGALGTSATNALIRSGCENMLLIDDDSVEATNLPRQTLYTEADIGKHKVDVAQERLRAVNTQAAITISHERLTRENITLLETADLVLDCTDNLETRRLIDEYCHEQQKPWVHAAVIRGMGEVMALLPGNRRYADVINNKTTKQDCAKEGILSTAAIITGTYQATIALKILVGQPKELENKLYRINTWNLAIDAYDL